jgi:aminoglycoside phosphotransferase (APT) family kinase protein
MVHDAVRAVERELDATPDAVTEVAEGLRHETYVVDVGSDAYVVQFAGDADDREDSLARGCYWYAALADGPVPVPEVVTPSPRDLDGRAYVVVHRAPGESADTAITPARTRAAARVLARIHDARTFDRFGWLAVTDGTCTIDPRTPAAPGARLRETVAESVTGLRDAALSAAADAVASVPVDDLSAALDGADPVLCHGDFSPDNLLYEGDDLSAVLDFDRATAGHPHRDVAQAATAFWMHDPCADWPVRETFADAYRAERPLGDAFDRYEPVYRVATLAHTVVGMAALCELDEYERGFYADRLVEAADRARDR